MQLYNARNIAVEPLYSTHHRHFRQTRPNPLIGARPGIAIDSRPIDKPKRVGLGVSPRRCVVEAVPVVGEAALDQEVLAGEAEVLLHRASDLPGLAEGIVAGGPNGGAGGIRQAKRAAEVVGVDHEELGGGGVHPRDEGHRQRRG